MGRFIFALVVVAIVVAVVKRRAVVDYLSGLSEEEIRAKVMEKAEPRLGAEAAAGIADKVVEGVKGATKAAEQAADAIDDVVEEASDMVESVGEAVEDAGEAVKETVDV